MIITFVYKFFLNKLSPGGVLESEQSFMAYRMLTYVLTYCRCNVLNVS